jgi:tetratricopeptide (TPR) repeat protein
MKRLLFVIIITAVALSGCGLGVSKYDDAIMDGASHLNNGKIEEALADFNRAIEIDPKKAAGYLGRANTLNIMGQYAQSIADYNIVIEINPKIANAYVNRGSAYSHLGEIEKAIVDYEKGLALDPKIDNPPGIISRLFSDTPNTDKGIRKHLDYLKTQMKSQSGSEQ